MSVDSSLYFIIDFMDDMMYSFVAMLCLSFPIICVCVCVYVCVCVHAVIHVCACTWKCMCIKICLVHFPHQ